MVVSWALSWVELMAQRSAGLTAVHLVEMKAVSTAALTVSCWAAHSVAYLVASKA